MPKAKEGHLIEDNVQDSKLFLISQIDKNKNFFIDCTHLCKDL